MTTRSSGKTGAGDRQANEQRDKVGYFESDTEFMRKVTGKSVAAVWAAKTQSS